MNSAIPTMLTNPALMRNVMDKNPDAFTKVFKQMGDAPGGADDLVTLGRTLDSSTKAKLITAFDDAGDVATKAKMFPDEAAASAALKNKPIKFKDGTSAKYGSKEFWDAIKLGAMIGAGYGLLKWIDDKFEDAEEEYKNCMAGCLPHNWDAYDQEVITSSELLYSNATSLTEYQITPIPKQPYCAEPSEKCEEFCDKKCDELTEVKLPFADSPLNPFNNDSPLNPFKWLERLLPDGFDTTLISGASSASSLAVVALVVMSMVMKR
jgi:hypothetical protein|tara:strand:+ start:461 stop:1255 length:795 start_codon:yes stop_codon:yes gene_type:complete